MKTWLGLLLFLLAVACSGPEEIPEVDFLSPDTAKVTYQGKSFILKKGAPAPAGFPLPYRFEEDGDLDLKIGGRWVEFDNPYDLDLDFKRLKKPSLKKKRYFKPRATSKATKKRTRKR